MPAREKQSPHFAELIKRDTPQGTGMYHGYFYSDWSDGNDYTYTNLDGSKYSVKWTSGSGDLVVGKGWNPGGPKYVLRMPMH